MQPLIKWPGGKNSEFQIINNYLPKNYSRYIEPFFGGGAVFFNLPPQSAIINDISENLINFYSLVKEGNECFRNYLYAICDEWCSLKTLALNYCKDIINLFVLCRTSDIKKKELIDILKNICTNICNVLAKNSSIIISTEKLNKEMQRMVIDKVLRTLKNEVKNKSLLTEEDLSNNILTGFTSGYYMYIRQTFNDIEINKINSISLEYKIALFYFVREFCYGSMFRYNKLGEFNIPYGGIAYNNKDFLKKINALFSETTKKYFYNTLIYNEDFEKIIDMGNENDFIFLDPPYDTKFSEYENRIFNELDQRRLEHKIRTSKSKIMLVIKNSPLILSLYSSKNYNIYTFDNKYSYCVKGRNDRKAMHLIITNY